MPIGIPNMLGICQKMILHPNYDTYDHRDSLSDARL